MKYDIAKRIGNLFFAAAIIVGAALPPSTKIYATELFTPTITTSASVTKNIDNEEEEKKNNKTLSSTDNTTDDVPTLKEFLDDMICSGCGRRCPLLNLKCGRGDSYLQEATNNYNATYANIQNVIPEESESVIPETSERIIPEVSENVITEASQSISSVESESVKTGNKVYIDAFAIDKTSSESTTNDSDINNDTNTTSNLITKNEVTNNSATNDTETTYAVNNSNNVDYIGESMEYIPLIGLAFGGIYFTISSIKKR